MPLLQACHHLGKQHRVRFQTARFGTLAVAVGAILPDPGPVSRDCHPLGDLTDNGAAVTVESLGGHRRKVPGFQEVLETAAFGERQWRTRSPFTVDLDDGTSWGSGHVTSFLHPDHTGVLRHAGDHRRLNRRGPRSHRCPERLPNHRRIPHTAMLQISRDTSGPGPLRAGLMRHPGHRGSRRLRRPRPQLLEEHLTRRLGNIVAPALPKPHRTTPLNRSGVAATD